VLRFEQIDPWTPVFPWTFVAEGCRREMRARLPAARMRPMLRRVASWRWTRTVMRCGWRGAVEPPSGFELLASYDQAGKAFTAEVLGAVWGTLLRRLRTVDVHIAASASK